MAEVRQTIHWATQMTQLQQQKNQIKILKATIFDLILCLIHENAQWSHCFTGIVITGAQHTYACIIDIGEKKLKYKNKNSKGLKSKIGKMENALDSKTVLAYHLRATSTTTLCRQTDVFLIRTAFTVRSSICTTKTTSKCTVLNHHAQTRAMCWEIKIGISNNALHMRGSFYIFVRIDLQHALRWSCLISLLMTLKCNHDMLNFHFSIGNKWSNISDRMRICLLSNWFSIK